MKRGLGISSRRQMEKRTAVAGSGGRSATKEQALKIMAKRAKKASCRKKRNISKSIMKNIDIFCLLALRIAHSPLLRLAE